MTIYEDYTWEEEEPVPLLVSKPPSWDFIPLSDLRLEREIAKNAEYSPKQVASWCWRANVLGTLLNKAKAHIAQLERLLLGNNEQFQAQLDHVADHSVSIETYTEALNRVADLEAQLTQRRQPQPAAPGLLWSDERIEREVEGWLWEIDLDDKRLRYLPRNQAVRWAQAIRDEYEAQRRPQAGAGGEESN